MSSTIAYTTAIVAAFTLSTTAHAAGWEKDGTKGGVTVYTKAVEGSDVPMVKVVTTVDGTTDEVWKQITQKGAKDKGVKAKKKLGSCSDTCEYVYLRLGHPLIKDRHFVMKINWSVSEKDGHNVYKRSWSKTSDKALPSSGALVPKKVRGSWTLRPTADGTRTRLTYINHMDLGGNVPAGLFSNGFIDKAYSVVRSIRAAF